ncbi:hypothetical protein A0U89_12260 [Kozakia baliensis]|uniref:Uncharacterized protein n=1 Tax=Kozakia baliensis TaxID=153496 RepID=A0A1D8UWB0_9PROT|nr:hypothetical protein A0U89_12260 [Kozakia baliensis]
MAFGIQRQSNGFGGFAVGIRPKDPADDLGLLVIDGAFAADRLAMTVALFDNIVAVAQAATGFAQFDAATQTPPGLVGQFLEIERIHRAGQANMEMIDLTL